VSAPDDGSRCAHVLAAAGLALDNLVNVTV
jgi:hypothetical protein